MNEKTLKITCNRRRHCQNLCMVLRPPIGKKAVHNNIFHCGILSTMKYIPLWNIQSPPLWEWTISLVNDVQLIKSGRFLKRRSSPKASLHWTKSDEKKILCWIPMNNIKWWHNHFFLKIWWILIQRKDKF